MLETPPKEKPATMRRVKNWRLIIAGLAGVLAVMGVAYGFISYELSGWDANKVSKLIGEKIHRQVHVGKTGWQLSLDGIEFNFASVEINEMDGSHFVTAGPSKLSLALTPLLHREFLPKNLVFQHPEIWLVKLPGGKWNYSDLPYVDATKYISHIGCKDGNLHVVDKSSDQGSGKKSAPNKLAKSLDGLTVENIKFNLNRPFGWLAWPFSMSFDVPTTKFHTKVIASGIGTGSLGDWKHSSHNWNIQVSGFDPAELTIFGMPTPPISLVAPIKLQLNGSGVLNKDFKTSFSFDNPNLTAQAKEIALKGNFVDCLQAMSATSTGAASTASASTSTGGESDLDRLLHGPLKQLAADLTLKDFSATVKKTQSSVTAVNGKITCKNGELTTENLKAGFASGGAVVSGKYSSVKNFDTNIKVQSINFETFARVLNETKIYTLEPRFAAVAGLVKSANLVIHTVAGKPVWTLEADPNGIYYKLAKQDKLISVNGGVFHLDEKQFKLNNITGNLPGGTTFKLNGTGGTTEKAKLSLNYLAQNVELATARKLLAILAVKMPASPADKMEGYCKQAEVTITGTQQNPTLVLKGTIKQIYVQDKDKTRTFELSAGNFQFANNIFKLQNFVGAIGHGSFTLNGQATMTTPPQLDVQIKAKDLDLSNVKVVLDDLKLESPLLAEALLAGRVQALDAHLKGTAQSPDITASLIPGDVEFEPFGTSRPIHMKNGHVTYINDSLKIQDVDVSTPRGSLTVTLNMDNLSKTSSLSKFSMKSTGLDIGDLNSYLVAQRTPPMVREKYLAILHQNEISEPKGKIAGHLDYVLAGNSHTPTISGQIHVADLSAIVSGFPVQNVVGDVQAANDDVSLNSVKGNVGQSLFALKGTIEDFANTAKRVWHLNLFSKISMHELAKLAGDSDAPVGAPGAQPVKIRAQVVGPEAQKTVTFTAQLDPTADITFDTPVGPVAKPPGVEARIDGSMNIKANKLTLNDTHFKFGDVVLDVSGSVDNSQATTSAPPIVAVRIHAADFVPFKTLVAFMPGLAKPELTAGIAGTVRGGMQAAGPANNLKFKGGAQVKDFALPKFNISQVNGKFRADDWISLHAPGPETAVGQIPVSFDFPTAQIKKLLVTDIKGKLTSAPQETWQYQGSANLAKGSLALSGVIGGKTATCVAKLSTVQADDLLTDLCKAPHEITGTMGCDANLSCSDIGADPLKSWSGSGVVTITNGRVTKFSLLEKRITQANLLKSGFMGFNLNNLVASVAPVEKGEFKSIVNKFHIQSGTLLVDEMTFKGDELRLRGKGKVDLIGSNMHFEISGEIPRVSQQGPLGSVAPFLGVKPLTDTLEDIPELFFMGKKTVESPSARVFAFSIKAPIDKPDVASQSIYKSFHWLQGSSMASAHPVLNVDTDKTSSATNGAATEKKPI